MFFNLIISLLIYQFCTSYEMISQVYPSNIQETEKIITRNVYQDVNRYRKSQNLNALKIETALNRIAYKHSWNMAKGKIPFSHDGFKDRIEEVKKFSKVPYTMAENLYATKLKSGVARVALKSWIESPGHHRNMLGDWIYTGVGVVQSDDGEYFITQVFVGRKKD